MAQGAHKITEQFENELCKYTGSPYAIAVDNCSNALFLALYYKLNVEANCFQPILTGARPVIVIPCHTYPSVPCEIIHAGGKVNFGDNTSVFNMPRRYVKGSYTLIGTNIIDASLSFTYGMYKGGHMCLSFTGPYKHLKLGKGGAILTNDCVAAAWFKRARFSGRQECSYFEDDFDKTLFEYPVDSAEPVPPVPGWNFYMMPEIAARGLLLMQQFYDRDGKPKHNDDLCLPYPDLSKFKIFQQ